MKYYPYLIRIDNHSLFIIWCSGTFDYVELNEHGSISAFQHFNDLVADAEKRHIALAPNSGRELDLDLLGNWLKSPSSKTVDPITFLKAWNLFTDVRSGLNQRNMDLEDKQHLKLYNKLFCANNLPAMTPAGKSFNPTWSKLEVRELHENLEAGFNEFNNLLNIIK